MKVNQMGHPVAKWLRQMCITTTSPLQFWSGLHISPSACISSLYSSLFCQIKAQSPNPQFIYFFKKKDRHVLKKSEISEDNQRSLKVKKKRWHATKVAGQKHCCYMVIWYAALQHTLDFWRILEHHVLTQTAECYLSLALDGVKLKYRQCSHITVTRWTQLSRVMAPTNMSLDAIDCKVVLKFQFLWWKICEENIFRMNAQKPQNMKRKNTSRSSVVKRSMT